MASYIQIDGHPDVLQALGHLLPQLESLLSPFNLRVLNVINDVNENKESINDVNENKEFINDVNEVERGLINTPELETLHGLLLSLPKEEELYEEVKEENNSPLLKVLENIYTYSESNRNSKTNKVVGVKEKQLEGRRVIEVKMKEGITPSQLESFLRYISPRVGLNFVEIEWIQSHKLTENGGYEEAPSNYFIIKSEHHPSNKGEGKVSVYSSSGSSSIRLIRR